MPDQALRLKVNNQEFNDWTSASIRLSMRTLANGFRFEVVEKEPPRGADKRLLTFYRGNPCEVFIDNKRLIKGFIDARELSYDANSHTLAFSGRDSTCDLVDCCYTGGRVQFKKATVLTICQTLAAQHGITVKANTDVGAPLREFIVDPTQTIGNQIVQACGYRALLPVTYGDSVLYLDTLSTRKAHDKIALGTNVVSMSADQDSVDRFSHYIVKSQAQMEDNPKTQTDESQQTYTKAKAIAKDSEVGRYRPQVILLDGDSDAADCLKRAQWEAWTRNGASREFTYTVKGWYQSNGDLWLPNTRVDVDDPWAWLTEEMVIMDVEFSLSEDDGHTTTLTIGHPYVFARNSEKEPDVGKDERKTGGARSTASKEDPLLGAALEKFYKDQIYLRSDAEARKFWFDHFYSKRKQPTGSGIWNQSAGAPAPNPNSRAIGGPPKG